MSVENPWEKNDNPTPEEVAKFNHAVWMERHDRSKKHATELQNGVAEVQEVKLGITLRRLMERTGNKAEIINGLNDLLDGLEHQSMFGDSGEPLSGARANDLAKFLEEAAKALRWTVGHGVRPADVKIDLSEWELNKQ